MVTQRSRAGRFRPGGARIGAPRPGITRWPRSTALLARAFVGIGSITARITSEYPEYGAVVPCESRTTRAAGRPTPAYVEGVQQPEALALNWAHTGQRVHGGRPGGCDDRLPALASIERGARRVLDGSGAVPSPPADEIADGYIARHRRRSEPARRAIDRPPRGLPPNAPPTPRDAASSHSDPWPGRNTPNSFGG